MSCVNVASGRRSVIAFSLRYNSVSSIAYSKPVRSVIFSPSKSVRSNFPVKLSKSVSVISASSAQAKSSSQF